MCKEPVHALKALRTLVFKNAQTSDPVQWRRAKYKRVFGQKAANKKDAFKEN